jgi:hypothetical protein
MTGLPREEERDEMAADSRLLGYSGNVVAGLGQRRKELLE